MHGKCKMPGSVFHSRYSGLNDYRMQDKGGSGPVMSKQFRMSITRPCRSCERVIRHFRRVEGMDVRKEFKFRTDWKK